MKRQTKRGPAGDLPGQLQMDWSDAAPPATVAPVSERPAAAIQDASPAPVQRLKWDFRTTFPQPAAEALDAGVLSEEDAEPENVRSLHEEHARQAMAVLRDLDGVLDARRRGVDPRTGRKPATHAGRERLRKLLATEPARLERWWQSLMDTYEQGFGPDAADAFGKAIRGWHAGVEIVANGRTSLPALEALPPAVAPAAEAKASPAAEAEPTPDTARKHRTRRQTLHAIARLPVPRPLPAAIAQGRFGFDEQGRPIRPGADEIRAISEQHAEKLVELIAAMPPSKPGASRPEAERPQGEFRSGITKYAEDFGERAAEQLEAYVRRQAASHETSPAPSGRRR